MIDFIVGLIMFIPNLIFSLIGGVFNIALYVIKIPFNLVGGLFHILMSPFVAIFLFFNPGQMDNAVATTVHSSPNVVAQSVSKVEKPEYYLPNELDTGYDQLMNMRGFQKPIYFTINDPNLSNYQKSNPKSIDDDGEEYVFSKIDLEKRKTYTFKGEVEQGIKCGLLQMAIMDGNGKILANSEVRSQPSFEFRPEKSRSYTLATSVNYHYNDHSCWSEITEYVKDN